MLFENWAVGITCVQLGRPDVLHVFGRASGSQRLSLVYHRESSSAFTKQVMPWMRHMTSSNN
jgi:hypothetical protein